MKFAAGAPDVLSDHYCNNWQRFHVLQIYYCCKTGDIGRTCL